MFLKVHIAQWQTQDETYIIHGYTIFSYRAINGDLTAWAIINPIFHPNKHIVINEAIKNFKSRLLNIKGCFGSFIINPFDKGFFVIIQKLFTFYICI